MNNLLIDAREKKGITRRELADFLEISLSMVEKVEKGIRQASPGLAKKWGDQLGLKETQLYRYFFAYQPDNKCREEQNPTTSDQRANDQQAATLSKTG